MRFNYSLMDRKAFEVENLEEFEEKGLSRKIFDKSFKTAWATAKFLTKLENVVRANIVDGRINFI